MEIFKIILKNPNYSISNYGNIKNELTGKILKSNIHIRKGRKNPIKYLRIELKNPKRKYLIHRLVAEAFINNPNNLKQINHIDENGLNNNVDNLEWCDTIYNCTYSQGKPVCQYNKNGILLNIFDSISQAGRKTGSDFRLIQAVCCGKRKSHNNYNWEYI